MQPKDKKLHRIAVTAIIYNQEGKFLVTKRAPFKKAFPNKWTVPGGGLNVDDYMHNNPDTASGQWYWAVEKTLRREVKEEVNVEIGKPQYLWICALSFPTAHPVWSLASTLHMNPARSSSTKTASNTNGSLQKKLRSSISSLVLKKRSRWWIRY
mgnify:CR=1 FL=1